MPIAIPREIKKGDLIPKNVYFGSRLILWI